MYKIQVNEYDGSFGEDTKKLALLIKKSVDGKITDKEFETLKKLNNKIFNYTSNLSNKLHTIFSNDLGLRIGNGQDNIVYEYNKNRVIKILSQNKYNKNKNIIQYYRRKYKILKKYLGEFVPDSYFLEGETTNHIPCHYNNLQEYNPKFPTIYTAQRKIKGYTLKDLPIDIKTNKKILDQLMEIYNTYIKLKLYVHFLEYKKFGKIGRLSFRMDIGNISKRLDIIDESLIGYKTQNIMYDFEKSKIYLIDFDSGYFDNEIENLFIELSKENKNEVLRKGGIIFSELRKKEIKITNGKLNKFFKNIQITF